MANEKRLIDANALRERHCEGCKEDIREMCRVDPICASLQWVDEEPTVDAVEVVHGYWIDSYSVDHIGRIIEHSIDCSVCDSVFKDESREVVKHWKERFEMCPFCGAKMDGDGNG